ncbi:hydrolase, alpha beta fold family domain containing protein [Musa troglodytarum]|uniref:Hydrolase, alpha beta fold family domain containing protein n=1 Tax=Musa troglodytarum TaxID=320322 RepID=A0A9E7EBS0_9LILI|nr:hydrolase, alpha beta fold family domain containing protein [Musa troglodytarum]
MSSAACVDEISATALFLRAVAMVPAAHYLAASLLVLLILFYNLFEFHFLRDLLHGFRGDPVVLTFNPASKIYEGVVSKCRIFHRRCASQSNSGDLYVGSHHYLEVREARRQPRHGLGQS